MRVGTRLAGLALALVGTAALSAAPAQPAAPAAADPARVVLVVADPTAPTVGEQRVQARWVQAARPVEVVDDQAVGAAAVADAALVFVAFSVPARSPAVAALASAAVPVWVTRPAHLDDFGLTPPGAWGSKTAGSIEIADASHPAAAGRTGTVTVQGSAQQVSWGMPAPTARVVATAGGDPSTFTLDGGAAQASGQPAPACRATSPAFANAARTFTADGWAMFDAMTAWTTGCPDIPPDPAEVRHVVLISVDGLNPAALGVLGPAAVPAFTRLRAEGVSTTNARSLVESTETLPNHLSMVTGRWAGLPGGTGVAFNVDNGSTVHAAAGEYVPSIFDVVHDSGGRTSLYVTKSKFDFLNRSWDAVNGAPDLVGADDGRDKVDVFRRGGSSAVTSLAVDELRLAAPAFTMLHLQNPDAAGHASGFMSDAYLQAVRAADAEIGRVLGTVSGSPALAAETVVVVTADHGGGGAAVHADATLPVNYTVPLFVWGAGVSTGDLYALNPDDRADPGATRPGYDDSVQPVRAGEVANLSAALLGLPAVPTSRLGAAQDLDVRAVPGGAAVAG